MRILIVEDEPLCAQSLQIDLLQLVPFAQIIGITGSIKQAAAIILSQEPDLVFLDVHLEDGQGTQLFQYLPADFVPSFNLIFTTAFDKYALRAFEMGALHYLLKPIVETELQVALQRTQIHPKISPEQTEWLQDIGKGEVLDKLVLISNKRRQVVDLAHIFYVEADAGYTTFYLQNEKPFITSKTLKYYEDLLPTDSFLRIHDKYLVNGQQIKTYLSGRGGELILHNGSRLAVAARRKEVVLNYLKKK